MNLETKRIRSSCFFRAQCVTGKVIEKLSEKFFVSAVAYTGFDEFDADIDMFGVEEKDWLRYTDTLDIEKE